LSQTGIKYFNEDMIDIHVQKAIVIEQFNQVNDIDLINAIKNMLDYAIKKEQEYFNIPLAHQELVIERFNKVRKNPKRLLDWNNAKKSLSS
jgi:hypothetical protein